MKNLRDKLSVLFNVPVQQEQQVYFEQFGIQIIASDDVIIAQVFFLKTFSSLRSICAYNPVNDDDGGGGG